MSHLSRKRFEADEVTRFAREHNPALEGVRFPEEIDPILRKIYALSGDTNGMVAALAEFHGPRGSTELLKKRLEADYALLQMGTSKTVPLGQWLDVEGWSEVQQLWKKYSPEWSAVSAQRMPRETSSAYVDSATKTVRVRPTVSSEPLPLVAAEEVFHIHDLALLGANSDPVESWVRGHLLETDFKDGVPGTPFQLPNVPQIDRDWRYDWARDITLKKIPNADVRKTIEFILERDAMFRKLDLYKQMVAKHPEFKTHRWEAIRESEDPRKEISRTLNEYRFHLSDELMSKLRNFTLEDIVRMTGGKSRKMVELEARAGGPTPKFDWTPAQLLERTPAVLQSSPFYGAKLEAYAKTLPEIELNRLLDYLSAPEITADPYAAQRTVQLRTDRKVEPDQRRKLGEASEIYGKVEHAILVLQVYDESHGTSHALDKGAEILRRLRPNPDTGDNSTLIGYISQAVLDSADPAAARKFFEALGESASLGGVIRDSNGGKIYDLLRQIKGEVRGVVKGKFLPPAPETIEAFFDDYISYHQGVGQNERNKAGDGFHLISARSMASAAEEYFRKTGDSKRQARYAERVKAISAIEDLLSE